MEMAPRTLRSPNRASRSSSPSEVSSCPDVQLRRSQLHAGGPLDGDRSRNAVSLS
jgi:hypothetical protein